MNPNETTINAPPDSVLPTCQEIVEALGEGWSVCDGGGDRLTASNIAMWERRSLPGLYPGVWLGKRGIELPYLHLRHKDGRRVRLEVPGHRTRESVLIWLRDVRRGRNDMPLVTEFSSHVRWLEPAGCGGRSMAVRAGEPIATSGGCLVEIPLLDAEIKKLSDYCLSNPWPSQLNPTPDALHGGSSTVVRDDAHLVLAAGDHRHVYGTSDGTASSNAAEQERLRKRWPGATTERAEVLEALFAEQVATGGQDCAAARRLLMMRERLREEAEARSAKLLKRRRVYLGSAQNDKDQAFAAGREQVPLTPGPLLWRHELPEGQRR